MRQHRHARRGNLLRPVPPPAPAATPPAPDDERVAGKRRHLEAVPDISPSPEPEEPAVPVRYPPVVSRLTPFQLSLYVPGDPDFQPWDDLLEQDFYEEREREEWRDRYELMDREPEIE
jgi:hypothetical protein